MKIRCDVCDGEEASVFCSADEAALCDGCDRRVHHANKLAGKHNRFSLLQPPFKDSPLCDICQERRAFLFCQEDRAILCRECDIPIHGANEHTRKHNRFLLTGVKLSAASSGLYETSSSSSVAAAAATSSDTAAPAADHSTRAMPTSSSSSEISPLASSSTTTTTTTTSSISEYLMETLPGWHVEDFLDPSQFAPNGFCKTNSQFQESTFSVSSSQELANDLVPQYFAHQITNICSSSNKNGVFFSGLNCSSINHDWDDISSTVPQITSPTFNIHTYFHYQ